MDSENQDLSEDIAGPSTSSTDTQPELQGLTVFPLVSPPRRAIFFSKPMEYREYQHPIPPMSPTPIPSPTPLPAHCNSTPWGISMNQMYPPFNMQYPHYPDFYGAPPPYYGISEELCVPPHAHLNNLPLARLVYRAMRYTPVYQPLLGRNTTPNVPQDLRKAKTATTLTTVNTTTVNNTTVNTTTVNTTTVNTTTASTTASTSATTSTAATTTPRLLCTDCKKTYATPSGLSKHQQFHCVAGNCSKKSFPCKQCDVVCDSFSAFKLHSKGHVLPCKCNLCGKTFSRSWLLQGHMRTHTGEKPFVCQQCKRSFADRSNLRAHIQVHNNASRFSCSICTKSFTRMSLLLKHAAASCPAQHALMTAIEKNAQMQ